MSLHKIKNLRKKESGFTIVELLIVIVIIGILAALVIVAYTGITKRAKDQKYHTDAVAIVKKAEAYAADNSANTYPTAPADFGATEVSKLPNGITVTFVTVAPTDATTLANLSPGYQVMACSTNKGLYVYWAKTSDGTVQKETAGTCP